MKRKVHQRLLCTQSHALAPHLSLVVPRDYRDQGALVDAIQGRRYRGHFDRGKMG
jgi:hypothetical protein